MTPEGVTKAHIKAFLKYIDAFVFMPVTSGLGAQAVDFIVCWRGIFIAIEAKAPGCMKKLTDRQRDFLQNVTKSGGIGLCVDSVELLANWWLDICRSLSIEPPDICFMTGPSLLTHLGFRLKKHSRAESLTCRTLSESRARCPISNDSTGPGSPSPLPSTPLIMTGRGG